MILGVDVGGTFTDAVLVEEDGQVHTAKVPTTPADQARGVLDAVREVLARAGAVPRDVTGFAHGMTVATNALLEGRAARTVLIGTAGFTDVIELGRQARAHLYRLCDAPPKPLVAAELRFAAPERCGPEGPLVELDPERAAALVEEVAKAEPEAVAVALLHSYAYPEHERMLGALLEERLGANTHVCVSSELVGTFREYERTATTVLDAALSPLVGSYLRRLAAESSARGLVEPEIMQSSGGLASTDRAASHAALTVLSGPAGGVGGALLLAKMAGHENVLCCDMGGTSCDVCLISGGRVAETAERTVAGRPLALGALDIHTVGAGGGSIAWRDPGGALRVGPESAGALPGPACYGRGGERATVTDANLLLGRLPVDAQLAGGLRLDRAAAERAVGALARELGLDTEECAAGIVRVAEAEMLRALRVMTVERGIDPREYALMPFGGAGPLHACALAGELGIERVVCPRTSGVLCALGLAAAAPRRDVSRTVMLRGDEFSEDAVAHTREELLAQAGAGVGWAASSKDFSDVDTRARPHARVDARIVDARIRMVYELRYRGQSYELPVESESADPAVLREAFAQAHEQRYGYRDDDDGGDGGEVELVTIRASVWGAAPELSLRGAGGGERIAGPAVYPLPEATLYVPAGWSGEVDEWGTVHLRREPNSVPTTRGLVARAWPQDGPLDRPAGGTPTEHNPSALDPIQLQVVTGALRAACEEMGAVLIRSARSSNIKERRDASTALFDRHGEMVMQAEHIPVHLGSMPAAVEAILGEDHTGGSSWVLNDPFAGGTHLPDITVITPVLAPGEDGTLIGFAASRAHHADVGGRIPGSMPADSRTLEEEGVVIGPTRLDEPALRRLSAQMRQPVEREADLRAQLAANRMGALRLVELARRIGVERLNEALGAVLDYAERRARACIAALPDGEREAEDVLEAREGDLTLRLRATVAGERLVLDFTGSAAQHEGNLNCPLAVTRSACLFAVRVLTDPDIPPSAGAYRPIEIVVPEGSILNARATAEHRPAVAAGNVETSSRVADMVLAAFGRAQGQGTMNNLTLGAASDTPAHGGSGREDPSGCRDPGGRSDPDGRGEDGFSYYETLGGGQGACADADGPSGVHVGMSNTLNTPVEALEREFPLRVVEYALRRGSGGAGAHRGGDGVVRELQALREMTFSLIAERRRHAPRGVDGGEPGLPGRDSIDGRPLPGKATGTLKPGQRLRIETPGGGGHGRR
jgi:N-methylhydantoinase A/oxoprolinase/acetone carboxylase beta subunit/N-methylhydantoinase B/oxoprolinase/acetone carboxylase alpha subunit